jgi:hypothetical protein
MRKLLYAALAVLPVAALGGLAYASVQGQTSKPEQAGAGAYVCPLTGEELPCPKCCPLNQGK